MSNTNVADVEPETETEAEESALDGLTMAEVADLLELTDRINLPDGIIVGHGLLGPEQAGLLLGVNRRNRNRSAELVESFARMMRNNQWLFNGAPVALGSNGLLQDGQHRLEAVELSGTVQPFMVMLGLPPEAQDVTDTGRKRSASDALSMHGVPNSANAAAMIRLLMSWDAGTVLHSSYAVGNVEVAAFAEKHLDDVNESVNVGMLARSNGVPISVSVIAALHFRLKGIPGVERAAIDEFFGRVCQGTDLTEGDPEFALRRLFMRRANLAGVAKATRSETLYYLIRAWNARMKGERLSKLQLPRWGLRESTFPRPISSPNMAETESGQDAALAGGRDA